MRLASLYLLVVAARAFVPPVQQPVAARTICLRAQEEASVGTAVRNIAPWLLFVLVEPALKLQGVRRGEGPRGLREPLAVAGGVIEVHTALASTAQRPAGSSSGSTSTASTSPPSPWLRHPWSGCASTCRAPSTATRFCLCGIATPSHRCSYGSMSRRLVRRPKFDFHAGSSPSSTPSPARRTA